MAIDTKSHTQVISEFRVLQVKEAISLENLGFIHQRIVDLLGTAKAAEIYRRLRYNRK